MLKKNSLQTTVFCLISLLFLPGSPNAIAQNSKQNTPLVVSSIPPLAELAKAIGGDHVTATAIISQRLDPHQFELKSSDLQKISRADLILFVGGGFEFWAKGLRDFIESRLLTLESTISDIEKIPNNYHYWLDPELIIAYTHKLDDALQKIDPIHADEFKTRAENLVAELKQLQSEISDTIKTWRYKSYFCAHPAWTYFARRFDLKELGCLKADHVHETGTKSLSDLYKIAQAPENKIFFIQHNEPLLGAQAFIADNSLKQVVLDDLGEVGESYPNFLKRNVAAMSKAMK